MKAFTVLRVGMYRQVYWFPNKLDGKGFKYGIKIRKLNQRTNGPVNAPLISGPSINTKDSKPG